MRCDFLQVGYLRVVVSNTLADIAPYNAFFRTLVHLSCPVLLHEALSKNVYGFQ